MKGIAAIFAVICFGVGVGVVTHWGAGVAADGLLLWIDVNFGK